MQSHIGRKVKAASFGIQVAPKTAPQDEHQKRIITKAPQDIGSPSEPCINSDATLLQWGHLGATLPVVALGLIKFSPKVNG